LTTIPQPLGGLTGVSPRGTVVGPISFELKSGSHAVEMAYVLDKSCRVRVSAMLPDGRMVADFDEGSKSAGQHAWVWNGVPGQHTYFVRLQAGDRSTTRMVVVP